MSAPDSDRWLRRSFARWWGLGCGLVGVVVGLVTLRWDVPGNTSTSATAAGPGWPVPILGVLLLLGCALAIGIGTFRAAGSVVRQGLVRARLAGIWATVACAAAAANVLLVYFPGPEWMWEVLPGPPLQQRLMLTLPLAGLAGGWASGFALRVSGVRPVQAAWRWMLGMGLAAVLSAPVIYLGVGGSIDLFEAVGASAMVGRATGYFLSALFLGYLTGALGAGATVAALTKFARPAAT